MIIDLLEENGKVRVHDLSKLFDVSAVTIRKDLKLLEDKGILFRSYGGASKVNPYITEQPINEKEFLYAEVKRKIGKEAVKLIKDDNAVIIASGTTVLALAREMKPNKHMIVITASLNIALELNKEAHIEVLQLGGSLRKASQSIVGPWGEEMLKKFYCNKLFLGADGLDLEFGLTTTSMTEAHLNKQMIKAAQKTIVLIDSSKFGRRGFGKICGLEDIEQIITDSQAPEEYVKALREKGIEVTLV